MPHHRLGRSWGTRFDSLTSSDSLSSNPESVVASSHRVSSPPPSISAHETDSAHDHDRSLQDASIFIGSLPTNIEHIELTGMLSQHLSEHPQVKGIKVVRDSKGGNCAFIQCQDAEAASILMHNLHVAPAQPFLGRYLRYEPARAFRTLLISYRSPKQFVRQRDPLKKPSFPSTEDPRFVELPLAEAMRIIRTPGNKLLTVLFNAEALAIPPTGGNDHGLLFVPLLYDAETLFRIASVFGAIDYFAPYAQGDENGRTSANFPPPHDGPRLPVMNPGCWRVKWAHRDDCISALVTLRRIPHLTVTWAHQSTPSSREQGHCYNPRVASGLQPSQSWRGREASFRSASSFLPASRTFPVFRPQEDSDVEHPSDVNVATSSNSGYDGWQQEVSAVPSDKNNAHSRASRPRALSLTHDRPQSTVSLPSRESTGQLSFTTWESTNRTRWADNVEMTELKGSPSSSPYLDHHLASSDGVCRDSKADGQDIDGAIPHTPEFGTSPITPRTPLSFMLRTPTTASYMGDFQSMSFKDYDSQDSLPQLLRDDHTVDPTTIFVGGLEMYGPNAWDEGKVRALFSKYGGVEAVKVIRPSNKRSAFAFVRFNNTDAPLRAIKSEHNRLLDGRLIRVQLRDWHPPHRPSWRPGPNKELDLQPVCGNDNFNVNPSVPEPGVANVVAHRADLQLTDLPNLPALPSTSEASDLNEVRDQQSNSPEVPHPNDVACGTTKETRGTERTADIKQGSPAPQDTTFASSQSSGTPAQALPQAYPGPAIQYYPGWFPNYVPPIPFQVPFTGQPCYSFPPPVVPPPPGGASESGASLNTTIPVGSGGGAYPAFMPLPPPLNHNSDPGQPNVGHTVIANNPTFVHVQAPLMPTGFIHGDQGMLVPVYPPDALNQYMTGNQDQGQAPANPGSVEGPPPVAWHPYPPPPVRPQAVIFHPYINSPLTTPPPPHLGAQAWIPGHSWQGVATQVVNASGASGRRIAPPLSGGPGSALPAGSNPERNNFVPPRRQYRRDNHSQHHKSNFSRGATGRFGKAPFDGTRSPSDNQPTTAPLGTVPDGSADAHRQRWNGEQGNPA